jgi:hypothetical protein
VSGNGSVYGEPAAPTQERDKLLHIGGVEWTTIWHRPCAALAIAAVALDIARADFRRLFASGPVADLAGHIRLDRAVGIEPDLASLVRLRVSRRATRVDFRPQFVGERNRPRSVEAVCAAKAVLISNISRLMREGEREPRPSAAAGIAMRRKLITTSSSLPRWPIRRSTRTVTATFSIGR